MLAAETRATELAGFPDLVSDQIEELSAAAKELDQAQTAAEDAEKRLVALAAVEAPSDLDELVDRHTNTVEAHKDAAEQLDAASATKDAADKAAEAMGDPRDWQAVVDMHDQLAKLSSESQTTLADLNEQGRSLGSRFWQRNGEDGLEDSETQLIAEFEVPAAQWAPIAPHPGSWWLSELLLVDGVRRIDARVWFRMTGVPSLGLAASCGAGVMRMNGSAHVEGARIARGVFTAYSGAADIATSLGVYPVFASPGQYVRGPKSRTSART